MQKWEYIFVSVGYDKGVPKARFMNGNELPDWKRGPHYSDFANQLGAQGWELIAAPLATAGTIGQIVDFRLFFKRPKP